MIRQLRPPQLSTARLQEHPLFKDIASERVRLVLSRVPVRNVAKGTLLHTPGEDTGQLYLVSEGRLRAYQLTSSGRKLMLEIIPPGGFDGLLPLLGQRGHFTEAVEDAVVGSLDWPLLEEFFRAEPLIIRRMVELVATRLERREEHLESMVIRDPTQRLARQLLALSDAVGEPQGASAVAIPRSVTHQLLADMLGIRRETVTLHLHRLTKAGAVNTHGRQLIVNPRHLQAIASSDDD